MISVGLGVLAEALNTALPQTQCTRCGYPDCRAYANAIAAGLAEINQCPPGGSEGVARLAGISGRPMLALNPAHGLEAPRLLALIDESACIGCTLCLEPCPVDCIVGAPKRLHTVIDARCTGCELCVPVCPVDCISLVPVSGDRTGWSAWSPAEAGEARERYAFHRFRLDREQQEQEDRREPRDDAAMAGSVPARTKGAVVAAALARSRARAARES